MNKEEKSRRAREFYQLMGLLCALSATSNGSYSNQDPDDFNYYDEELRALAEELNLND